jgi:hypothetical protein
MHGILHYDTDSESTDLGTMRNDLNHLGNEFNHLATLLKSATERIAKLEAAKNAQAVEYDNPRSDDNDDDDEPYWHRERNTAERILQSLGLDHHQDEETCEWLVRKATSLDGACRKFTDDDIKVPVRGQMVAWMLLMGDSIRSTPYENGEFANELIRLAKVTGTVIRWRSRESHPTAIAWMDHAWTNVKLRRGVDA